MKILMLGWEYPPQIAGGLGIACEGLTKALVADDLKITFVMPRLYGQEQADHMELVDSRRLSFAPKMTSAEVYEKISIPAFLKPYWSEADYQINLIETLRSEQFLDSSGQPLIETTPSQQHYGNNLMTEVSLFSERVVAAFAKRDFDLIHAHDWMTFPAAVTLAKLTGRPLIVHVHSLESDRSGFGSNQEIEAVERMGFQLADKIIAVSHYTKDKIKKFFNIIDQKISVIHNGIYGRRTRAYYQAKKQQDEQIVLFLGRVTFQKGPEYFVQAAAKVLSQMEHVRFVLAGSGDQLEAVKKQVRQLSLERYFSFPGFVRGEQIEEIYNQADLYVMPSVSEPFGITALEAVSFSTPILISKQSGVAEVISNSLKSDFWDIDRIADLIINALQHPELRQELSQMASQELKSLRWEVAARKTRSVYKEFIS